MSVLTLLGGGGIGGFLTWKYTKRMKAAEAEQAETAAVRELQDAYHQFIADIKEEREEQKTYINELKTDRAHLREERDELRKRIDKTDEVVRELQNEVAKNGRRLAFLRPLLCGRENCKNRTAAQITE